MILNKFIKQIKIVRFSNLTSKIHLTPPLEPEYNMKRISRLLIIDDDADDRDFFIESVKEIDESIECTIAYDGQHALSLLQDPASILPHVIFLDLRMPRIDGRKCLVEIKKDNRLKHIPIIIYTTLRDVKESQELRELGAVHFISKPSNPDEIYYLISVVLDEQWSVLDNIIRD